MGWIKRWRERREEKRKLKELAAFVSGFKTMDQMADSGLLAWNMKQRQLFIDSSLAFLMMRDARSWTNFINNVFLWQYSKECERAWADFFLKEELAAVRQAKKKSNGKVLSRSDVDRIREARRDEILQSDMQQPKIEGFEFFIVKATAEVPADQQPGDPVGQLIAVGHYEPETERMEMALWDEIRDLLNK